ncbi:cytochrome P450 [Populus alba x Populus x berolinensis]|nr:cytochrome P450 [Populus alba x Populus x berolinensis]
MESWFLILVSISISLFLKIIFNNFLTTKNLPPGPLSFPFIGHLLWLRMSAFKIEPILRSLHAKYGPMVTLRIGTRPAIFVADRTLAHEALIHGGAVFADRPPAVATRKFLTSNQHNISSSFYGPTWRLLRRNLTAEILHLSRVKSYSHARNWVLQILQNRFESQAKAGRPVCVMEHFQYAMFCLLVLMCFGDKLDENQIKKIMEVQRQMIVNFSKFNILNFWPGLTKIVLRNRWRELFSHRKCQEDVLIPLIRARKKVKEERVKKSKEDKKEYEDECVLCYVDTILALELPEEKRKLTEGEMVSLCSEFLNAGTDTTSTALQWIMANLVKHPQIQEKLLMEIKGIVQDGEENIKEEDLQKMPYLKATILEGLRRHPPAHFVLPLAVTEDVVLGKYVVPKDGTINFMVAEMGWNPEVWEDPMAFKPERFLNSGGETFDITGSREITMMPFGAGRRICPAYALAILHLEYFVANLIWRFEWNAVDGDDVDLTEKEEFTVVMKNPLQAQICPRSWFLILVSISISLFLKIIFNNFLTTKNLPPGPLSFPFIGHLPWLRMSAFKMEPILRSLHAKFGPMVTLRIGTRPTIFVADRTLAHEALIRGGAVFADRPPAAATRKFLSSNQHNISSSFYGPTWRLLRRNLTAEILHLSRVKSYSHARNWVLQILQNRFESQAKAGRPVCVMEHFQYAMFCLLVLMCFGDKLDENQIKKIMEVQRQMIVNFSKFNILNFWPGVTKIVLRNRWRELFSHRKCQEDVLIPLIRARKKVKEERVKKSKEDKKEYEDEYVLCYVDTILALELPEEKRKLTEGEMVSLCSEFLNAGTDSTSTALQWIMANLVKHPQIQEKLFMEIKGVVQDGEENIKEEDLQKMPYLKATILEGLRRHPPGHFALPHAVTEDVVLGKYVVPRDGTIHFMVAEMGWNPEVWEDPMAFKPERFLNSGGETFDITGSREIKMMPFGAGRRICPAYALAILHLEYFVANLIWRFEWKAVDGDDVDLTEKEEFTVVMKNPLQAQIFPRLK